MALVGEQIAARTPRVGAKPGDSRNAISAQQQGISAMALISTLTNEGFQTWFAQSAPFPRAPPRNPPEPSHRRTRLEGSLECGQTRHGHASRGSRTVAPGSKGRWSRQVILVAIQGRTSHRRTRLEGSLDPDVVENRRQ